MNVGIFIYYSVNGLGMGMWRCGEKDVKCYENSGVGVDMVWIGRGSE